MSRPKSSTWPNHLLGSCLFLTFCRNIDVYIDPPIINSLIIPKSVYRRLIRILHPEKPAYTTELLTRVLNRLPNLRWFGLNILFESSHEFDKAMQRLNATGRPISAKSVSLGPFTQGILRHMPFVNDVAMYDWRFSYQKEAQTPFIEAILGLPLEHVQIQIDINLRRKFEGTSLLIHLQHGLTHVNSYNERNTVSQATYLIRWRVLWYKSMSCFCLSTHSHGISCV
jgi:hypothetical protein